MDIYSKRENININFNVNNNSLLNSFEGIPKQKYLKTIKYSSLNKGNKYKNLSPRQNKSLRNTDNKPKTKQQKKELMNAIQKRLNNLNERHTNYINHFREKKIDYINKNKNKESNNNTINSKNNIILNSILTKNKKKYKNKKVKIVGISYQNNKYKNNNINSINNSSVSSPSKLKSLKKPYYKINNNNLNGYSINNYKHNIAHRHTKSSFNQETHLLTNFMKDLNNTENINYNNNQKGNKYNKRNIINNNSNYNTKNNLIKDKDRKSNKTQKNTKYNIKLSKHNREHSDKGGLIKIIDELKINNHNNTGLTKKFINAQNNWRKNYFATVIQKIFRGYALRKSNYREKYSNKNVNSIYIRKKAKDNKIFGITLHHRKCPTEENLNLICQNINKKYSDKNDEQPPKIKEIVIFRNVKKDTNNPFQFSNLYLNNYIYNYNQAYNQSIYQINLYKYKYAFEKWKEYSNKKRILLLLKSMKKYDKKINKFYSDEKKNENFMKNYSKSFVKQLYI